MNRIRYYRQRLGMSQRQLALLLGIARQSISDWERGRRFPEEKLRDRLQAIFLNAPDLLSRRDELPTAVYRRISRLEPWPRSPDNRAVWRRGRHRYRETLHRLPDCPLSERFESSTRCDSLEEVLAWLILVSMGGKAYFASPYRIGDFDHAILDIFNVSAGARLMPCLHLLQDGLELLVFPQVRMRPDDQIYVVDALMLVIRGRLRRWMVLELDGKGHNPHRDQKQKHEMTMPIIRITGKSITTVHFWPTLRGEILKQTFSEA